MIDFSDIHYLSHGNDRQRKLFQVLQSHVILRKLSGFDPIVIGSIPIGIDIPGSDVDIACQFGNREAFVKELTSQFSNHQDFLIKVRAPDDLQTVTATFWLSGFVFEIFGQLIPVRYQLGYRHLIIEHRILEQKGEAFRNEILRLKSSGIKTEPAFAKALGIKGEGYLELLQFE